MHITLWLLAWRTSRKRQWIGRDARRTRSRRPVGARSAFGRDHSARQMVERTALRPVAILHPVVMHITLRSLAWRMWRKRQWIGRDARRTRCWRPVGARSAFGRGHSARQMVEDTELRSVPILTGILPSWVAFAVLPGILRCRLHRGRGLACSTSHMSLSVDSALNGRWPMVAPGGGIERYAAL
eukprot:549091-Prymnesium_polylepis.1